MSSLLIVIGVICLVPVALALGYFMGVFDSTFDDLDKD